MSQAEDPAPSSDWAVFARELMKGAVRRVQTAYPARVLAYHAPDPVLGDPATVDVQVARKYARQVDHGGDVIAGEDVRKEPEWGLLAVGDVPPIPRVVVHYPGFAGMRITGPIPVGEEGLLITCTRSIDRWVRRGADPVQDPVFPHAMNLKDSIFLPGLRAGADEGFDVVPAAGWRLGNDANTWELLVDEATSDLTLRTDGPTLTVDGAVEVKVGANATNHAAAAELVEARLNALRTAISTIPPTGVPQAEVALTAIKLVFANWAAGPVAATKVKVE